MSAQFDAELAALRVRRTGGLMARLRQFRPFDRRSIPEPAERDEYWANVKLRLAQSDATFIRSQRAVGTPVPGTGSDDSR